MSESRSSGGVRLEYLRSAVGVATVLGVILMLAAGLYLYRVVDGLPTLDELENPRPDLSTRIYSADGIELDQFFVHNRRYIPIDSIPKSFITALIATEDQKFYSHWGVDIERIVKAAIKNVTALDLAREGASTITQQLARNLYFTQEVTVMRKLREQFTAIQIERTYTKDEILEMYANTVYFGRGAYGIQVASEIFFNKQPVDLTIQEAALLVGMLKAPEGYNPVNNYEKALKRRNTVLSLMARRGYITSRAYREARETPIELHEPESRSRTGIASHFVEAVRRIAQKEPRLQKFNLYRDGLVIYTTLDTRMQQYANQAVREHLEDFQSQFNRAWSWRGKSNLLQSIVRSAARKTSAYQEATDETAKEAVVERLTQDSEFIDSVKQSAIQIETGFVVLEAETGYVRALVGGSDFTNGRGLNHVTQIRRQPGSAFKPFVYASALQQGMSPSSGISTAPVHYRMSSGGVWSPKGGAGRGVVPLSSALKYSMNTAAARLILERTSPEQVVRLAKEMGVKSPIPNYPSIALGTAELTPYEMTAAFATFPNNGVYVDPTMITKIEDRYGNLLYQAPRVIHDALEPGIASQMVSMMRGVVDGGTASGVRRWFSHPAAGKTGTTNDFADAWFVGYTPELCAGVWVGFDDHRIKFTGWYGQGGKAAAPVWARFMSKVYKDDRLPYDKLTFDRIDREDFEPLNYDYDIAMKNDEVPADVMSVGGAEMVESGTIDEAKLQTSLPEDDPDRMRGNQSKKALPPSAVDKKIKVSSSPEATQPPAKKKVMNLGGDGGPE